ncbi:MAG: MBL fold metallo-hydrolase [Desulfobacteraceae bacterium]|jgi:glyoxylase-like metal-dependent hydrolase (beta-lactamase superfamily II)
MVTKITHEIFQVGGSGLTSIEDAAIYLIHFGGQAALVDAGCGHAQERLFKNIRACAIDLEQIEYLLITHCHFDHTGGIQGIKERTRCKVVAHELEASYLEQGDDIVTAAKWYGSSLNPVNIDIKLQADEGEIDLGGRKIKAIHTPGHSPGSVVYTTESEGLKILFAQDVHGPLDQSLLSDREDYVNSLNLLLSMEADVLCEGHYGVFRGKEEVADFIRSFL